MKNTQILSSHHLFLAPCANKDTSMTTSDSVQLTVSNTKRLCPSAALAGPSEMSPVKDAKARKIVIAMWLLSQGRGRNLTFSAREQ